jgi:hypothetical protein
MVKYFTHSRDQWLPHLHNSQINTQIQYKVNKLPKKTELPTKKWITFTFRNPTVRKITNLFRNTNLKIAFKTNNSIQWILNIQERDNNQHSQNGIYRMICHTCHKSYIGQAVRKIETRYKEHIRYIRHNNSRSAYASHILQNTHEYGPLQTTMDLLQKEKNGIRMNTLENYYIQHFTHHNNIIDEQSCVRHNPLFQLAYSA